MIELQNRKNLMKFSNFVVIYIYKPSMTMSLEKNPS